MEKKKFLILFLVLLSAKLSLAQGSTPCSATTINVGASCSFTTYNNSGSTDSGIPSPACGSYTSSGGDVWFVVTVPSNGNIQLNTQSGGLTDAAMAIYSGPNCSSLTEVQCDDDDGNGSMPYIFQSGLTPGSNLWIRVWDFDGDDFGTFGLCAFEYSFSPQDCPGGTTICSNSTFSGNSSGLGDFSEIDGSNGDCMSAEHESSWYFFSPQSSGTMEFDIVPSGGTAIDIDFAIWGPYGSAVCPPTGLPIRCNSAAQGGNTGLQLGAGNTTQGPGAGSPFSNELNVIAGEVYVMVIDNFTADGSTFDLNWNLSGGASLDCTILDVELVKFLARQREDEVELVWATATEVKTDYFIIQRAGEDGKFEDFLMVDAKGGVNQLTDYSVIDPAPLLGTSYYKLLEVTQDGLVNEYKTVSVDYKSDLSFKIYPNPVKNEINITCYQKITGNINYDIIDLKGRSIQKGNLVSGEENINTKVQLPDLNDGFYIISLTNNGEVIYREKFVKK